VDWAAFAFWVAVTVVGGLVLGAIGGGVRWYSRRRERKAKEAEQRAFDRIPLRAGAGEVARDLRANADVSRRYEDGDHEARGFRMTAWPDFKGQISVLESEASKLWRELEAVYKALGESRLGRADPPSSQYLLELADRLEEAAAG